MENFAGIWQGLSTAIQPSYLLLALAGAVLGTATGVLPGIGPSLAISLLMPITFQVVDPLGAMIMFGGIFYGAMYGGSTTTILINTPGESSSVVTAIDGYQMARKGRAGAALATAAIGSFIAGTIATFFLMILAQPLVLVALRFGPAEYFALMILSLCTVTAIGGGVPAKAAVSTLLGLLIGTIGIENTSGQLRFTFGLTALYDGIDIVVAAVGFFAISEVLFGLGNIRKGTVPRITSYGSIWMTAVEWRRSIGAWLRGSFLGFFVGVLPGAGATIAAFMSYGIERKISKHRKEFGSGAIEGVAGPESANNASAGGALVPLLTLGIPGSATAAVMLAALQGYGINTGPLLLQTRPDLVWGLVASLYIGNFMLLVLNLPLIGLWVRVLKIPESMLYPIIIAFAAFGVYTLNYNIVDLYIVVCIGLLGFALRLYEFPLAPIILGIVLGPLLETEFRRALIGSRGDWTVFVTSPLATMILFLSAILVFLPMILQARRRWLQMRVAAGQTGAS
jgi:putative tricarboxylic transport membrane protein